MDSNQPTHDYYTTLGVQPSATADEIKKSYHRLARENHPDKNPNNPEATARFQNIAEAFETLSDSQKRELYNDTRTQGNASRESTSGSTFPVNANRPSNPFPGPQTNRNSTFDFGHQPPSFGSRSSTFSSPPHRASASASSGSRPMFVNLSPNNNFSRPANRPSPFDFGQPAYPFGRVRSDNLFSGRSSQPSELPILTNNHQRQPLNNQRSSGEFASPFGISIPPRSPGTSFVPPLSPLNYQARGLDGLGLAEFYRRESVRAAARAELQEQEAREQMLYEEAVRRHRENHDRYNGRGF